MSALRALTPDELRPSMEAIRATAWRHLREAAAGVRSPRAGDLALDLIRMLDQAEAGDDAACREVRNFIQAMDHIDSIEAAS